MKLIDLHIHTNASDGSYTPSEICSMAYETGLSAIAITDHDTVDGLEEAISYAADNNISSDIMEIIPGIELSCKYKEREIHILGLYMDYKNPQLLQKLNNIKEARFNRNVEMCKLFQADGIDMTIEKLQAGNPNTVITRAHFARVLLEEGIVKTKDQAFKKYIGRNNKYYLPKPDISCDDAMDIINNYGKAAILAHPLLYKFGYAQIEEMLDYLKTLGLVGLEAYHSSNNSYESGKLRSIAHAHNLCISGGTDFHGVIKPDIKIGCGRGGMRIPYKLLEDIKASIN
jgi:hypothetical protein